MYMYTHMLHIVYDLLTCTCTLHTVIVHVCNIHVHVLAVDHMIY